MGGAAAGSASAGASPAAASATDDVGIWDTVEEAFAGTFDKVKSIFGF